MPAKRRIPVERRISEKEDLFRAILNFARQRPDGVPIRTKDFAHLGPQAVVNRALGRLVEHGRLVRVGRGLYAQPIATRLGKSTPPVEHVIFAAAQTRGETVAAHGSVAAYNLGLTTRAPAKLIYLTSGPSRRMTVGGEPVEFRHAPDWQLNVPVRRAGNVIRALAWIGPDKADDAVRILGKRLPPVAVEELAVANTGLPPWLSQILERLVDSLRRKHGGTEAISTITPVQYPKT